MTFLTNVFLADSFWLVFSVNFRKVENLYEAFLLTKRSTSIAFLSVTFFVNTRSTLFFNQKTIEKFYLTILTITAIFELDLLTSKVFKWSLLFIATILTSFWLLNSGFELFCNSSILKLFFRQFASDLLFCMKRELSVWTGLEVFFEDQITLTQYSEKTGSSESPSRDLHISKKRTGSV